MFHKCQDIIGMKKSQPIFEELLRNQLNFENKEIKLSNRRNLNLLKTYTKETLSNYDELQWLELKETH